MSNKLHIDTALKVLNQTLKEKPKAGKFRANDTRDTTNLLRVSYLNQMKAQGHSFVDVNTLKNISKTAFLSAKGTGQMLGDADLIASFKSGDFLPDNAFGFSTKSLLAVLALFLMLRK